MAEYPSSISLESAEFASLRGLRLVERMPVNETGIDYVVGDLHGCREGLDALLNKVDFNPQRDRLFSVGDLVDRGPSSVECLELLDEPWFFAVMGNHEQLMLNYFHGWLAKDTRPDPESDLGLGFVLNGGAWVLEDCQADFKPRQPLSRLLFKALDLPMILIVGEGWRRFNVVHAELAKPGFTPASPEVWTDFELDMLPEHAGEGVDFPELRWSRELMGVVMRGNPLPDRAPGLSTTFCGHNIAPRVRKACSHVCLDTGGFLALDRRASGADYGLTLADPIHGRCYTWRLRGIEDLPL